jgi:hypothetical protein
MTASTAVFTSIAANYLPKARVLAQSIKQVAPDTHFVLMLVDEAPADFDLEGEIFDSVMTLHELGLENPTAWAFMHTVVELCTAVKGRVARQLLAQERFSNVFYFDPDMVVFDRLAELEEALSEVSILLTPHQSEPEESFEAVMDNEMASLKHGVFNMGFFGIADTAEGRRFTDWWADRLTDFCVDDIGRGLFTDQKWANLIPCFFDDYRVLRSPAFNVATWNITTRAVTGSREAGIEVNGEPLGFYHFSGFDSGDQALMLNKYGADSPTLAALRAWYVEACEQQGENSQAAQPYGYGVYADGSVIRPAERRLYRARADLQQAFPNPFVLEPKGGFSHWYAVNVGHEDTALTTLSVSHDTSTREALQAFADWIRHRALMQGVSLKRATLLGLSKMLKLFSRGAS